MLYNRTFTAVSLFALSGILHAALSPTSRMMASALQAEEQLESGAVGEELDVDKNLNTLVVVGGLAAHGGTGAYSKLFNGLRAEGHQLEILTESERSTISLFGFDERLYNNLMLVGVKELTGPIAQAELTKFIDTGGNVLVMTGGSNCTAPATIRLFANHCGVDFDRNTVCVEDHFSHHERDHQLIKTTNVILDTPIVDPPTSPLLFKGLAAVASTNAVTILSASPRAASDSKIRAGDPALIAGSQANNNARSVVAGSVEMCSDDVFKLEPANENFCLQFVAWTFHQRGVIVWKNLIHHKVGETKAPHMYRMKDVVSFSVDLHELKNRQFQPLQRKDVQLELTMLDPYIRVFLDPPVGNNPTFSKTLQTPDKYGIFKFVVNYRRLGYNSLNLETLAPLRNFKHNDYERFLVCAIPYYASVGAVWVGLLGFCFLFLYHQQHELKGNVEVAAVTTMTPNKHNPSENQSPQNEEEEEEINESKEC